MTGPTQTSNPPPGVVPEVDYVAVCTGPTDLLVGAVCRDNQHLLEVVTHGIRQVPGVVETDTAVILSELKDSYRFSEATLARPEDETS